MSEPITIITRVFPIGETLILKRIWPGWINIFGGSFPQLHNNFRLILKLEGLVA